MYGQGTVRSARREYLLFETSAKVKWLKLNPDGTELKEGDPVRNRIQSENRDQPWDGFEGNTLRADMRLYGRFRSEDDLRDLPVIRLDSGRVVRLGEVAERIPCRADHFASEPGPVRLRGYPPVRDGALEKSIRARTMRALQPQIS